eukprot:848241_1
MESSKVGVPPLSNHKHDGRDAIDDLSTIKVICHRACFQDIHAFVLCDQSPLWCIQPRLHHPKVNNIEAYHSDIINKDQVNVYYPQEGVIINSIIRYGLIYIGVSSKRLPREDVLQPSLVILLSCAFVENLCLVHGILSLMACECGCTDKYGATDMKLLPVYGGYRVLHEPVALQKPIKTNLEYRLNVKREITRRQSNRWI